MIKTIMPKPERDVYRGSPKHKNRPSTGPKGTLCPEWTHTSGMSHLGPDPGRHDWAATVAEELFQSADEDLTPGERYATMNGIAFKAVSSGDGTWHGYPVPWESVPAQLKDKWVEEKRVERRQIKRFLSFDRRDIHWALQTDSR